MKLDFNPMGAGNVLFAHRSGVIFQGSGVVEL